MTTGKTKTEVLTGDVFQKLQGDAWAMVLTASGISVVDNWKMPPKWRDEAKVPYVPGNHGAQYTYHTSHATPIPDMNKFYRVNYV